MEQLTKKELRALLESIKECYPICDVETFGQRVISRLSKIVPKERNARATDPLHASTSSEKKILEQCMREYPVVIHHGKTRDNPQGQLQGLRLHNKFYPRLGVKYRIAPRLIRQFALNRKSEDFGSRDQLLLKLLRPHIVQAYRNAKTVTHIQQELTLVEQAVDRLNLGLIFLTLDGKIRLATTWAMQRLTSYLGPRSLRKNRLPAPLWTWVKQREVALAGKDDVLLQRNPLVLTREGKHLVIRLVSDLDQNVLLLEEHPTTMQSQPLALFGLSPREAQVLSWVSQGKTNKDIGMILELSPRTVQKHLEHIYQKVGVESRTAAAAKAYEIASIASKQTVMLFLVVISSLMM